MVRQYRTIVGSDSEECGSAEYIVMRSRFLGAACHVESDGGAEEALARLRRAHPFASHICYAYVAERGGAQARTSDGGEPGGTAGRPIAEAIRQRALSCVLVAVVRYFGGVKLGAGNLARAYGHAARLALERAQTVTLTEAEIFELRLSFADAAKIRRLTHGIELSRTFAEEVVLRLASATPQALQAELNSALGRSASPAPVGTEFIAMG
jgi:uncharacterized YigZ family protein